MDKDSRSFKMRRMLLDFRIHRDQENENIDATPRRRSCVRFPRVRLLDFKPKNIPRSIALNCQPCDAKSTSQVARKYPFKFPSQGHAEDRFINIKYNKEAANYLLTKKPDNMSKQNEIDVFKQLESLSDNWRKKFMHQLMAKENVIPGLRQKQVLRRSHLSSENKVPGSLVGLPKDLWDEEHFKDGMWKSKPRKRPLIGIMYSVLNTHEFSTLSEYQKRRIDWSSADAIAVATDNVVKFYNILKSDIMDSIRLKVHNVDSLKWNNAGNKLLICTPSFVKLYCIDRQKTIWTTATCDSDVTCVCWSKNDQHAVTADRSMITIYLAQDGKVVNSFLAFSSTILTIAFSSNYGYLATSAIEGKVRIFQWPSLNVHIDILYYEPILALAWHPYESGLLCIGGGLGDASLTLWDMNRLSAPTYRDVRFQGIVKNMIWNKHSGELVVHWSYAERHNDACTAIPVLASLDRIVDEIPLDKEMQINAIMWNSDQTQLALQSDESLMIWNFFGNDCQYTRCKTQRKHTQSDTRSTNFKEFEYYNIR
ncbi:protein cortex [Bombus terrestris]|uniref:Protein cortex n=1 Tax=Bombus terrestris TaxID=30195 RepID=A0A9B2JNW1_BOMTE|nr:protein cortex [Bombus terrestris]